MSYNISQRIKDIRIQQGYTQDYVANKLNISRQKYSRIESNQAQITFKMIEQLSDIFKVSTKEITKLSEEKKALKVLFRQEKPNGASDEIIDYIQKILEYMKAHERLYYKMKEGKEHAKI